jgi:RNA polymerase sigma factor (sigma-70 family)
MLNNTSTIIAALLPNIRATVARIVGERNPDAIDDLVNDTVVRLLAGGLDRCDGRASAKSWVTICARNVCIDYVRTSYVKQGHDTINMTDYEALDYADNAVNSTMGIQLDGEGEDVAERSYEASKLEDAMSKLLSAQEQTFIKAIADGATLDAAVCEAGLSWSRPTATRRHRAIRELLSA